MTIPRFPAPKAQTRENPEIIFIVRFPKIDTPHATPKRNRAATTAARFRSSPAPKAQTRENPEIIFIVRFPKIDTPHATPKRNRAATTAARFRSSPAPKAQRRGQGEIISPCRGSKGTESPWRSRIYTLIFAHLPPFQRSQPRTKQSTESEMSAIHTPARPMWKRLTRV